MSNVVAFVPRPRRLRMPLPPGTVVYVGFWEESRPERVSMQYRLTSADEAARVVRDAIAAGTVDITIAVRAEPPDEREPDCAL